MEKKASLLEVDDKNAQRKLIAMDAENCKLKEETSKLITQVDFFTVIYGILNVALSIGFYLKTNVFVNTRYPGQAQHDLQMSNRDLWSISIASKCLTENSKCPNPVQSFSFHHYFWAFHPVRSICKEVMVSFAGD